MVRARNAILASLPLPEEVPEDMLSPLSIPAPFTLQEFISNLSGVSKSPRSRDYAENTAYSPSELRKLTLDQVLPCRLSFKLFLFPIDV